MNQHRLPVHYGDGVHARVHRVQMWVEHGMLQLAGDGLIRQVPLSRVRWSGPQGSGLRFAHFTDGGGIQALDPAAWDQWLGQQGLSAHPTLADSGPHGLKSQNGPNNAAHPGWRWVTLAAALLMLVAVQTVWWGITH